MARGARALLSMPDAPGVLHLEGSLTLTRLDTPSRVRLGRGADRRGRVGR